MAQWLEIARNRAEERFRSLPLPGAKDENFRFTPLAKLEGFAPVPTPAPAWPGLDPEEAAVLRIEGDDAKVEGDCPGLLFTDLLRAVLLGVDHVSRLKHADPFPQDKVAQLTSARWRNGVFLHVPAGVKAAKPLRVAYGAVEGEDHARHLVLLEEGAEATLVQEVWSPEGERLATELTEIRLGRNSRLHWVVVQRYGSGTKAFWRQQLELAEGARLDVTPVHFGAGQIQVRQEARLVGEGSALELAGAARGADHQHFDFWLDVDHAGSRSRSQVNFSFVMGEAARSVFNGLIQIRPRTPDCEASQKAKSLLLGTKATVHAIPKLIIQTDAVKCSHGATVASVNPEQVHYLQSRGIPKVEAERMIIRGFTEPVLARLPTESLQARTEEALDQKQGGWLQ